MRILFLSHYFPPEVNAPASRTYEHCKLWIEKGHEVSVMTCVPNHPAGRIFPGYKNRLFQKESIDGIEVSRLLTILAANSGFLRRTLSYAFFMVMAILAAPFQRRPEIVISTSPQFFCGLAGYFVSRIRRVPWVLEIRDLWPESIVAVGAMKKSLSIRLLEKLESFAYRKADHIISVTDSFVSHIVKKGGSRERISVVKNGVDLATFEARAVDMGLANQLGLNGKFVASYVGTHGMAHGLEVILRAAESLRNEKDIAFLLVGDGATKDRFRELHAQMGLKNVVMLDQQPKSKMPAVWSISSVSLVLLRDQAVFRTVIPSKIFESMAMQCPIILGVRGESQQIVDEAGAGICIEPENSTELAEAILAFARNAKYREKVGLDARRYVEKNFDRRDLASRFELILKHVIRNASRERTGPMHDEASSKDSSN